MLLLDSEDWAGSVAGSGRVGDACLDPLDTRHPAQAQVPIVSDGVLPKPKRVKYTRWNIPEQNLCTLEESYSKNPFPSPETRQALADDFKVQPRKVQVWFQNKRQRASKPQDASGMPRSSDDLSVSRPSGRDNGTRSVEYTMQQTEVFAVDEDEQDDVFPPLPLCRGGPQVGAAPTQMPQSHRGGTEANSSVSVPNLWPLLHSGLLQPPPFCMLPQLNGGLATGLLMDGSLPPLTLDGISEGIPSAMRGGCRLPPGMSPAQGLLALAHRLAEVNNAQGLAPSTALTMEKLMLLCTQDNAQGLVPATAFTTQDNAQGLVPATVATAFITQDNAQGLAPPTAFTMENLMLLCTQGIGMPPAARQFGATTAQTAGGGGSSSQGQRIEDLVGDAMDELETELLWNWQQQQQWQ